MMRRIAERGTAVVETALVLGVFLLLMFGIMDFGRLLYTYHLVDNAARLGTRFAVVHGAACANTTRVSPDPWPCPADGTEIQNYVRQQSILMGIGNNVTVTNGDDSNNSYMWPGGTGCQTNYYPNANGPGCPVVVTVNYTFSFWLPLLPNVSIPLSSTSEMITSQ
jgi:Flp pilus assembly protein TadG